MTGEAGDAERGDASSSRGKKELLGFKRKGHVASIAIMTIPLYYQWSKGPEGRDERSRSRRRSFLELLTRSKT